MLMPCIVLKLCSRQKRDRRTDGRTSQLLYATLRGHKKLRVAHTVDFNHTNYTLKQRHNITPYSTLIKNNNNNKKKSLPTLPLFLRHVTGIFILFGLTKKYY